MLFWGRQGWWSQAHGHTWKTQQREVLANIWEHLECCGWGRMAMAVMGRGMMEGSYGPELLDLTQL